MLSLLSVCTLIILQQCVCRVEGDTQLCSWPCKCPRVRTPCAPGVSAVLDGCGCCKSCARQVGDVCNERDVCDPHKHLYCDYSADTQPYTHGLCRYLMAVGCDMDGVHYDNGQSFQPSSLYKCVCIAGAIGCTPVFIHKPAGLQSKHTHTPHTQDSSYRTMSAYRDPPLVVKKKCVVQSTAWSSCSQTCNTGISTRISNNNNKCELRKERRLCVLRPCDQKILNKVKVPAGKRCVPVFQQKKQEKLTLSGCRSVRSFRLSYCGHCSDLRTCRPNKSNTIQVNFLCPAGDTITWSLQRITSCVCERTNNQPENMFSHLTLL